MKARVKATGEIIDVDFDENALANGYPPYRTNERPSKFFLAEQLEWIDIKKKAEPDYWTRLEHTYAGMAMQGLLQSPHLNIMQEEPLVGMASSIALALVEKMKEKK